MFFAFPPSLFCRSGNAKNTYGWRTTSLGVIIRSPIGWNFYHRFGGKGKKAHMRMRHILIVWGRLSSIHARQSSMPSSPKEKKDAHAELPRTTSFERNDKCPLPKRTRLHLFRKYFQSWWCRLPWIFMYVSSAWFSLHRVSPFNSCHRPLFFLQITLASALELNWYLLNISLLPHSYNFYFLPYFHSINYGAL